MTILAYIDESPLPIGVGSTKEEAIAEALLTIVRIGRLHETLAFREVDLSSEKEQMLRKAIEQARRGL